MIKTDEFQACVARNENPHCPGLVRLTPQLLVLWKEAQEICGCRINLVGEILPPFVSEEFKWIEPMAFVAAVRKARREMPQEFQSWKESEKREYCNAVALLSFGVEPRAKTSSTRR